MNEENTVILPPEEQAEQNDRDTRAEELESIFSYDGYQKLVSFDLDAPFLVENGKALDESPTKPLCRAESFPAQNNPTSPIKRDSGAV